MTNIAGRGTVTPGEFVSYDLTVANTTREGSSGVRLLDVLPVGFSLKKGSVRLNGTSVPDPAVSADGKVLTFAVGDLAPESSSTISFMVEVTAGSRPGRVANVAAAISRDGVKSDTAKEIVTVRADPVPSRLRLSRSVARETVAPGEFVSYDLTVANTSSAGVPGVRLLDMLPVGFCLKKGSVQLNGISAPDPAVSIDGKVLTFTVGDLAPASSSTISFMVEVTAGSTPGKVVDVAAAISSDGWKSDTAKEIVTVRDDLQPAKAAANITPVAPQEAPPSSAEKASGATAPAADSGTIAPQAAVTANEAAAPSPDLSSQSAPQIAPVEEKPQAAVIQAVEAKPTSAPPIEPLVDNIPPLANDPVPSHLRLTRSVARETVAPGEFVSYDLTVAHTSSAGVPGVRLLDMLPVGFCLKKGSVQLNGISAPDPAVSTDGKVLTFTVGDLAPASSSTISFMVEVTAGSTPGKVVDVAAAISSDGWKSDTAKEIVTVRDDLPSTVAASITPVIPLPVSSSLTLVQTAPVNENPQADGSMASTVVVPETRNPAELSGMVEVVAVSKSGKVADVAAAISSDGVKSDAAKEIVTVRDDLPVTVAANITPVAPQEAPPSSAEKASGATAPAADSGTIAPQAAVTANEAAAPSPDLSSQSAPQLAPVDEKPQAAVIQTVEAKPTSAPPIEPLVDNIPPLANVPVPSRLRLSRSVARETVAPGEFVGYDLTVSNTSSAGVPGIRLLDMLPAGFSLKKGSVQLNGISAPDPAVSTDGKVLTFTVGDLAPASSSTISFMVEVTAGSTPGKVVDVAAAISSDGWKSDTAKEIVTVRDDLQPAKAAANITPSAPQEAPQASVEKASGSIFPAAGDVAIASEAAVVVSQVVVPSPPVVLPSLALPKAPVDGDEAIATHAAVTAVQPAAPSSVSSSQTELSGVPDKEEKLQNDDPVIEDFVVQKTLSLAELIGKADISVLSDVDGQFVKNMAENQTLENEFASQVDETNLLESIRVGRGFNRESRAALARTEQANAQTGQAFALLLPSMTVRANYGSETSEPSMNPDVTGPDTHTRTDASLSIRQTLFDLPSFLDWRRRKVVEQARGENYKVSDGEAYISAVNAYLSIVSSRLQTDMTREFESKLNDLLIYVEKRAKAGAASHSDMARVRARSQATLSSRLEQESAHAAAGIEFIRLTNLVPRKVRLPALEDIGASLLPKSLDMAVTTAMKSNPEIAALNAEIEAAEIDKQAAKGRYLPRIDAEYTNTYSLHAGGNTSSAGQKDQRIMAVLNWSLFSGGSDYKTHVERTARHKEFQYRLDDQRRRVVQSLSANYATLATTRERITSGYQELKSISTAAEAMSKRMLSGNQSLLDMLDVYDRLYQVRSRLVSLHILEMSTAAQLVRLMQGAPGAVSEVKTEPNVKLQSK